MCQMPYPLGMAMVDINDFNLFDLVGLGDATGLEWIFGISALLGGILFLLWFVLMLVGGVAAVSYTHLTLATNREV